jgi:chromosome segregation ATPase
MRGLGREEEDLEDTVSHLSIYLTGLDRLYSEQAKQLKHQIRRAEKAEQELEVQFRRAMEAEAQAESSLASLRDIWQRDAQERERIEAHRREAGLLEGEPEETHWDKSTQTEGEVLEQCLPPKKRPNRIGEGFPWESRVPKLELSP